MDSTNACPSRSPSVRFAKRIFELKNAARMESYKVLNSEWPVGGQASSVRCCGSPALHGVEIRAVPPVFIMVTQALSI